ACPAWKSTHCWSCSRETSLRSSAICPTRRRFRGFIHFDDSAAGRVCIHIMHKRRRSTGSFLQGLLLGDGEAGVLQLFEARLEGTDVIPELPEQGGGRQHPLPRAAVQIEDLVGRDLLRGAILKVLALGLVLQPAERHEHGALQVPLVPFALLAHVEENRLLLREGPLHRVQRVLCVIPGLYGRQRRKNQKASHIYFPETL